MGVSAGALLLVGALVDAVPAEAVPGPYSGWTHREDARTSGSGAIDARPGSSLRLHSVDNQVSITSEAPGDADVDEIEFLPPAGATLQTGVTYRVGGALRQPTPSMGQVLVHHNGTMCGRTDDQLSATQVFFPTPAAPAAGWFHVDDVEYDDGMAVSFSATYEISCQYLDGPAGFEGSVAVNASLPPAPVPDAPATPGPVTGLTAHNTNPDLAGTSTTTLSWTNPGDYGDITVDLVHSADRSLLPAVVAGDSTRRQRGRESSYYDDDVEFMDVRTYRVVASGTSGRLGAPAFITVMGSRLDVPAASHTITIGEQVEVHGRLTKALGVEPHGDPMSGPALPGRTVVMCSKPTTRVDPWGCDSVDSTTTSADGRFTLTATPVANSHYTVMVPSASDLVGNRSWVVTTGVAPQTDLRAPADQALRTRAERDAATPAVAGSRTSAGVRRGSVIHFTTSRARRGSLGVVRLQHLSGGTWHTIMTRRLGGGKHRLGLPFREHRRGLHSFRIVKPADPHHVNGHSRIVKVRVT